MSELFRFVREVREHFLHEFSKWNLLIFFYCFVFPYPSQHKPMYSSNSIKQKNLLWTATIKTVKYKVPLQHRLGLRSKYALNINMFSFHFCYTLSYKIILNRSKVSSLLIAAFCKLTFSTVINMTKKRFVLHKTEFWCNNV